MYVSVLSVLLTVAPVRGQVLSHTHTLSVLEERIGRRRLVTRLSLRKGCRVMACIASICVCALSLRTQSRALSRARSRTTGNRIAQLSVFLCLSARFVRSHTTRGHVERECRPENIDICTKHKHNKHVSPLPYPSSTQGGR